MDALLLGIYGFFVWLIFFKFKWLPWNTVSQVIVITIPIVGLTVLILLLNVFAPTSSDVRVIKYVVNLTPQVRGKVLEVPAEGNKPMKKGDVLFRIDPTPYQMEVDALEAKLANTEGGGRELTEELAGSVAQAAAAKSSIEQASSRVVQAAAQADLAKTRVAQYTELKAKGAGNRFDLEQAQTNLREAESALDQARAAEAQARGAEGQALAGERQIRQRIGATTNGELSEVAQARAELDNAKWELAQTTVRAPSDGTAINLQLRTGAAIAPFPAFPAVTWVENDYTVIALFHQNELHQVKPGDEAEIVLLTNPGEVIKAKVDSIVWAQGQGQSPLSNALPQTGSVPIPEGRFPVKLKVDDKDKGLFLAAGARGQAAIYTEDFEAIHILRKVLIRVATKMNYLILKLH